MTDAKLTNTPLTDAPAAAPSPALQAAIRELPAFLRYPIFLPTERVPEREAIDGLARVRALYDTDLDAVHRPRLRALKAARRNRRCFVIGNGPSLASTDLGRLRDEVTFATNGFFLKMPELDWRPTYYVVEDHLVGEDRAPELNALRGTTKLFPASLAYALLPDEDTTYFDHRPRKSFPDGFDFSFDADVNTWTGGTVTFTCMQLAAYLGFQEIYLVGVDASYSIPADAALSGNGRVKAIDMASDDPNHFHPDYFGKGKRWHEPNVDVMLGAYAEARRATEGRGVSIVNATVGGKLEVFPRIDYEMLFRPAPAERLLVLDLTTIGDATASGEMKAAVLGGWPADRRLQVYDERGGQLRIAEMPEVTGLDGLTTAINAFDPDLVLYRPVPKKPELHGFAMDLIKRRNLPLAVWLLDDWPTAYAHEEPERARTLDADLRWLLGRADVRLSISPEMSTAFHERYGHPFVPLSNGVDPADWTAATLRPRGPVRVRYAGNLADNMTLDAVRLVAGVVERIADSGVDISLEVKASPYWHAKTGDWAAGLRHTTVTATELSIGEYRQWLSDADVLLIAYNFDARSRDYIRYSVANKLPECLASGAAVLAVGPEDIGTIARMAALDVGERVTVADEGRIEEALRRLAASPERRLELGRRGQKVAFSLFDARQVRAAFDASVGRIAAAHLAGDYPRDLHANVDETAIVADLLADRQGVGHVMLDVGAQRGASAIHFARLGWTVHCFEPHPISRHALSTRFADRPNVHVDPRALGAEPAKDVALFESPESSGIAALNPFLQSHVEAARVDVTTVAHVVTELDLSSVDFLKIDVEGVDFAVLRTVPWDRLRPDVIECEFEDARTRSLGHTWRDVAAYLGERGYAVYVSVWHPVIRYGVRHDWRRVMPFAPDLELDPDAWGNLVAFRVDPGWDAVRQAFDRNLERGQEPAAPAPVRSGGAAAAAKKRRPLARRILGRGRRILRRLAGFEESKPAVAPGRSKRAAPVAPPHGHELLARLLPDVAAGRRGFVVEVGTTREKLPGQGSTVVLAELAAKLRLSFVTVDMDPANTEQARLDLARIPTARAETAKGEEFLATFDQPIVAAYLDAFDIQHGMHSEERVQRYRQHLGTDITNAAASAMHLAAAEALRPWLVPGGLVVIDDTWADGAGYAGKGRDAVPALLAGGFAIVGTTDSAIALRSPETPQSTSGAARG
jgi:FkbM family methyltransferase